jgi:hypothetical protein
MYIAGGPSATHMMWCATPHIPLAHGALNFPAMHKHHAPPFCPPCAVPPLLAERSAANDWGRPLGQPSPPLDGAPESRAGSLGRWEIDGGQRTKEDGNSEGWSARGDQGGRGKGARVGATACEHVRGGADGAGTRTWLGGPYHRSTPRTDDKQLRTTCQRQRGPSAH